MKIFCLLILLTVCSPGLAQLDVFSHTAHPFQVLIAVNCTTEDRKEINSFDLIPIDNTIHVGKGGTITLVHATGLPLEYVGETTIQIRSVHDALYTLPHPEMPHHPGNMLLRPSIQRLAITSREDLDAANKKLLINKRNYFQLISPYEANDKLYCSGDLYLKWLPMKYKNFNVKFSTFFEDVLFSKNVTNNELIIEASTIQKWLYKYEAIQVTITSPKNNLSPIIKTIYPYPDALPRTDLGLHTKSAAAALMIAYRCEMEENMARKEAEQYYKLAAKLSDHPFFREMMENYYGRGK